MEREDLVAHLRAWCDGVDPADGRSLPRDHPAQRADTLRVLLAALRAIVADPPGDNAAGGAPAARRATNAGRPWPADEDARLAAAHDAGSGIADLARAHDRTRGAITARLVRLGRLAPPPGLRLRGGP